MSTSMPTDDVTAAFRRSFQVVVDRTELPSGQVPTYGLSQPSRRPRYGWPVAAAVAAVLVVVGVVGVALVRDNTRPAQSGQLAGFRAHTSDPGGGMDAIVSGIVEIDQETGCVWLSDPSGARYPVIWPVNTTSQANPPGIVLPGGQVVVTGDRVQGGGGSVDADTSTSGLGLEPFPEACVQVGDAAAFNPGSSITVTPGEGLEVDETLVSRFSPPQPIGLQLIAVNPNGRSVAVVDFVTGTVHQYEPGQYEAPTDAIDGASGGNGFTHLWANGTISTFWPIDSDPLVYQPEPLREIQGIAPTLEVLPAPDGDHTWLIQPGFDDQPTLVELVDVVGFELSRLMTTEIDGSWHPVGTNVDGIVLISDEPEPRTIVVGTEGSVIAETLGTALSVGWEGVAVERPDGSLVVTNTRLGDPVEIDQPGEGEWAAIGGPMIPATSPPMRTGTTEYLVQLIDEPGKGEISSGELILVRPSGSATPIYELAEGSHMASWSPSDVWVVIVENAAVTLVSTGDGSMTPLGELIPESHYVLSAG
ncbi:MAG: hypothetical protein ACRDWA_07900 [Acidimicrobiia bacterium]